MLKIRLNLFESSNLLLRFENLILILILIWILFLSSLKIWSNMDQMEWCHVCVFEFIMWQGWIQAHYTAPFEKKSDGIKKFQIWNYISKLDFRFQINSNGFSRHRSFGQECLFLLSNVCRLSFFSLEKNCCASNR